MSKVATLKAAGASKFWLNPKDRGATNPGNLSTAKAYVHVYHPTSVPNEFDIQFWYFYPYNGPGRMYSRIGELWDAESSLEPLGEHVGDWEVVTIRFSDATLTPNSEFLSAHGDYPETDWKAENLESGSHLRVYASRNGHAHYLTVGNNAERVQHVNFGLGHLDVDLYNVTSNGGQSFNSSNSYEIIASEKNPLPGAEWIAFPGRWGPEEELHLDRNKAIELVYDHLWPGAAALCGLCFIPCGVINIICAGTCCGIVNGVLITIIAAATDDVVDLFAEGERSANGPVSPAWNENCKNGYSVWFYNDIPDETFTLPSVNCP
jgi:hypothetical protein